MKGNISSPCRPGAGQPRTASEVVTNESEEVRPPEIRNLVGYMEDLLDNQAAQIVALEEEYRGVMTDQPPQYAITQLDTSTGLGERLAAIVTKIQHNTAHLCSITERCRI